MTKKPKPDDNLTKEGKRAIAWLKKKAVEYARKGSHRRSFTTGQILKGLGVEHEWDTRNRVYRNMMKALTHGKALGMISEQSWGSPKSFQYIGPEVAAAEEKYKAELAAKRQEATRAMNKLHLKGYARENCAKIEVIVSADSLISCTKRLLQKSK